MKKSLTKILILCVCAMVSIMMVAQIAKAGIATTKHDLSTGNNTSYKGSSDQICVACHTPHNASATQLVPLWNHTSTATTFTLYTSGTLNATVGQPTGSSKACLSCHDGSVAANAFTGNTALAASITGDANLGTTLANDHPISFDYAAAQALDSGLVVPTSTSLVVAGIPLYSGNLECASCHNVHDNTNSPFLRASNTGSALCLKCHEK